MKYEIFFAAEAIEDLNALSARDRQIVRQGIEQHLRYQPYKTSKSRIKRLRRLSHPQYRLRLNDFRIFYDIIEQDVEILAIVPKRLATEWLSKWGEES